MKDFEVSILPIKGGEFFTTYTHPLTKKKIRQRFTTRQEAFAFKQSMEDNYTRRPVDNLFSLNVSELVHQFNLDRPTNPFAKSKKMHFIDFVETFGTYKVEELTTDILKAWLDQVQKENNLKNISMRSIKCDVDYFFKYLSEKDVISDSPLTTIYYERSAPPVSARNILSPEEIGDLLKALKAFSPGYLYPLIKMFAETAGKTTEVTELLWNDINFDKGEVHFVQTSGSRERTLKISDEMIDMLKKKKTRKGHVFQTFYGETFTKNKIRRAIIEFQVKASFKKDWTPMDLRHSFAVNYLRAGGTLKALQYVLGHNNVFQTKQLYGEIEPLTC